VAGAVEVAALTRRVALVAVALLLAGCAATAPSAPDARLVLFGEQHDQPDQQRQVADAVRALAARGTLGALVLEMAERGRGTAGLPRESTREQVREALAWSGWDWPTYEAVVMTAVRAGVPVLGGNLPRARMREAMQDGTLDARIDAAARDRLADAVRVGHCGVLPASQEPGMVRIQIARDAAMAQTLAEALATQPPGRQVLLLAGAQHVARDRGIPLHLASAGIGAGITDGVRVVVFGSTDLPSDERRSARRTDVPDACEAFRKSRAGSAG
jgi:uncharacterized iron-regulated protein